MAPETGHAVRPSTSLIHFYFVTPPLPPRGEAEPYSGRSPDEHPARPSSLLQRWARNPEGTLAPCWHAIADRA